VRNVYDLGDQLLIVATDRISAFDHVLGSGIPDKAGSHADLPPSGSSACRGRAQPPGVDGAGRVPAPARFYRGGPPGRSMLVRRTTPLPIECVARATCRARLEGLPAHGRHLRHRAAAGTRRVVALPAPIFTPATKAETGHDENIPEARAAALVGADVLGRVKALTLDSTGAAASTRTRAA